MFSFHEHNTQKVQVKVRNLKNFSLAQLNFTCSFNKPDLVQN
jgi:hypothetical protein